MFDYDDVLVETSSWRANCIIPSDLACLRGHFPSMPILPAIAQLDMVMGLISHVSQSKCVMTNASMLKFIGLIKPNDVASLILDVSETEVKFSIFVGEALCTRGKLTFRHLT